jgi:hypothetical protein
MAAKGGERRMVFDIRGRRKHVVKVVYAILALLMGASLFFVVGPVNIGNLLGNAGTSNSSGQFLDEAERIEAKLKKQPEDPNLLVGLMRARISAGNSLAEANPETGEPIQTVESHLQLEEASEAWEKYLKATDEPNAGLAVQMASIFFILAQTSRTADEFESNIHGASQAQQISADKRPSKGSLSTLAIYHYFGTDFKAAEAARKQAATYAKTRIEKETLKTELDPYKKRGHEIQKQLAEIQQAEKKARAKGESAVANPLAESNPLGGATLAPQP